MADQFQAYYYVQQGQQSGTSQPLPYAQPAPIAQPAPFAQLPPTYPPPPGSTSPQPMPHPHQPVSYPMQTSTHYPQAAPHPYQPYPQMSPSTAASPQYYPVYPAVGSHAASYERPSVPSPVPSPTPSHRSFTTSPVIRASTPSAPQQYPPSASPIASPVIAPQPVRRAPQVYSSPPSPCFVASPQLTSVSQINLSSSTPPGPASQQQVYQAYPVDVVTPTTSTFFNPASPLLGPAPMYEPSSSPAALGAVLPEKSSPFNTEPPAYTFAVASSAASPSIPLARVDNHAGTGAATATATAGAAAGGGGPSITNMSDDAFYDKVAPRVLPSLPVIQNWKPATGTTEKVLRLDPLPYRWTPDNPEGESYFGGEAPRNGYQNVVWRHAMPSLGCDGCHRPQAFDHRIRYTCTSCPAGTFDLCETCFTTQDVAVLHNPNHDLYRMDIAFPDWSHPCWNAGVTNVGGAVSQVGSRTLHWDADNDYKKGDIWAELYARGQVVEAPLRPYEVVEWNGMAMSVKGMVSMLMAIQEHVVELNFRSNPNFNGFTLLHLFKGFLEK
ncbi:hypothetical protein DFQ26_000851, partial [Actinomortierella ambigua]